MKVLITCPPLLKSIDSFKPLFDKQDIELILPDVVQSLSEKKLIDLVPRADGWIIGDDPVTEKVLAAGKKGNLKAAVRWGVGVDNVDFKAARSLGIPISNTPGMFGSEVADIGICYLTGLARQTFYIDREVRKGHWIKPQGISLTGKSVALIGLGHIGLAVARRLKGFDLQITGYDPSANLTPHQAGVHEILLFPEKIEIADFILITCSLTPSSLHLINESVISKMKDGVYIINISRGKIIDEKALINALVSGKVRAAALDVFEDEPLPSQSPLRSFEQCIFGTHNGSNTLEAVQKCSLKAIDLLFGYLNIK
jgi:D-3-phosphoglycerate dehydrogenase